MKRKEKMNILSELLKNGNRFTVAELVKASGSERVARSAIWLSRHDAGMKLEAIRDGGRKVVAYVNLMQKSEVVTEQKSTQSQDAVQ